MPLLGFWPECLGGLWWPLFTVGLLEEEEFGGRGDKFTL